MNDGWGRRVVEVEVVNENFLRDRRRYTYPRRRFRCNGMGVGVAAGERE